jgi:CRISPR/Cas system endoribonuclease Cas6 (RAMP superfamily)
MFVICILAWLAVWWKQHTIKRIYFFLSRIFSMKCVRNLKSLFLSPWSMSIFRQDSSNLRKLSQFQLQKQDVTCRSFSFQNLLIFVSNYESIMLLKWVCRLPSLKIRNLHFNKLEFWERLTEWNSFWQLQQLFIVFIFHSFQVSYSLSGT